MISKWHLIFLTFFSKGKEVISTKKNQYFHSKVFLCNAQGRKIILKLVWSAHQEARRYLFREHEFTQALAGKEHFCEYHGSFQIGNYYVLAIEWVDGYTLAGNLESLQKKLSQDAKNLFNQQCWEILRQLKLQNIIHRDVRPKNIIIRGGKPILVDFGWAVWENEIGVFVPQGLQNSNDIEAMQEILSNL